jgi:glycine/D-amino acid oxidase-like deaminating enzyme
MRRMDIFAPGFQTRPYWWDAAAPTSDDTAAPPAETEVAIVGGGYAGLSAALTLRRLGHAAVVLDAAPIAFGASSRNGGMVSGGLKLASGQLERRFGPDRGRAIADAAAAALPFIEQLIAREDIACDYVRCGRFVPAWTPGHYRALAAKAAWIQEVTGLPAGMLPRARQGEHLASTHYHGGMLADATGSLHPGKYARGLAAAARRAGATLVGDTPVEAIGRDGAGFVLRARRGILRARHVLVATNGYSQGGPMRWLARRVVPVASYIIATEPLGEARVRALFPTGRMIADTKRVLNYFRPSPDFTRVLWGGRASFRPSARAPERAAPVLWREMTTVFPSLRDARITHAWTGNVAFTFDGLPHLGIEDGVHYAAGCQGSGVAMMSWMGHQAALRIAGAGNAPFALDGNPMPTVPAYGGRPWFLPLVGEWMRWRDRVDRALA